MKRFDGKVLMVTGASSGIGRATALALGAEGAKVALVARRADALEEVAAQLREGGGAEALVLPTDVTDEAAVLAAVERTKERFGRLDAAVNAAGSVGQLGPVADMSLDAWREVLDANATSTFLCSRAQAGLIAGSGGGAIVNVASAAGNGIAFPGAAMYGASKAAVRAFSESLALELASAGVRVNVLAPGGVDTPMFRGSMGSTPESASHIASLHAFGRVAQPEEIARAALYLASDDASFSTGSTLYVDGGMVIR